MVRYRVAVATKPRFTRLDSKTDARTVVFLLEIPTPNETVMRYLAAGMSTDEYG